MIVDILGVKCKVVINGNKAKIVEVVKNDKLM